MSILLQKAEASFGKILKNSKLFSKRTSSLNTKSNQVQQTERNPKKKTKRKRRNLQITFCYDAVRVICILR